MNKRSFFPVLFSAVLLFCVLFIVWYLPALNERLFQIEDTRLSLETSLGRERKQQREYNETAAAIPEIQAELDRIIPLNEAMLEEKKQLKTELKALKKEKEMLEKEAEASDSPGVNDHE